MSYGGTSLAISFVAASSTAPGFEMLVNILVDLALRRWGVAARGLGPVSAAYLALVLLAALTYRKEGKVNNK